jgi:signal transduction histidine kinase
MTDATTRRTGRELDMALVSARQTLDVLRSQVQAGRVELKFFDDRLASLGKLFDEVSEDRKQVGQQERLAKLYEVSRVIGSSLDLQTVLDQVMDAIIQLSRAERGFLMLLEDDGTLAVQVARNFDQENVNSESFALSRTITRRVLDSGAPIVTTNAQEDPRFASAQSIVSHALRSIMATPLRARGQIIGVVYVDNRMKSGLFSEKDLDVLDAFAGQAAVAIDNARLFSATDKALAARVEELTMLGWIDRQLNETLDMQKVQQLTVEWSMRSCGAANGCMVTLDRAENVWRVTSYFGAPSELSAGATLTPELPFYKHFQEALEVQDSIYKPAENGSENLFLIPVRRENQVIAFVLLRGGEAAFADENRHLVERVAERAAIALENGRLYEAVRSANLAKSEFVSMVAHELKLPMTSINGYADLMKMAGPVNEKQDSFVATIKNAVNRMKLLVTDLSDISRMETGHLRVELSDVEVKPVIDATLEGTLTEIQQRNHQLSVEVEPNLPPVRADKERLTQILLNLVSNAYKYTPDGGRITIQARRQGDRVAFSVRDTGVGLSAEQLAKLGTKFWRADNGLGQSGTGLGFAITRNLIDLMHGELTIESEPGKGSLFMFTVPIVTTAPATSTPAATSGS